jgi:arylsulfatase A-like enzyme
VTALAELIVTAQRKFLQHEIIGTGWHITWMTPLSYLLVLVPVGIALTVGMRVFPRLVGRRVAIFVVTLASAFSFFFLFFPALHRIAIVLLALGVAVQTTRVLGSHVPAFCQMAPRLVRWGFIATAGLGLGSTGWNALRQARAMAALPAAESGAPNLLLIVLDTVRAMSMGLYGHSQQNSPHLEQLARGGVLFRNAFSPSSWTLPGHATMFTGRYPAELAAGWQSPLREEHTTLAEVLSRHGYLTAGFVANLQYATREVGVAQGFIHYEDFPMSLAEVVMSSSLGRFIANNPALRSLVGYYDILGRKTARDITNDFLKWVRAGRDRPVFAFLNYYDAHEPYLPPSPYDTTFGDPRQRNLEMIRYLSPRMAERTDKRGMPALERLAEEQAYDAAIAYMDAELGRLLDELDRRGLIENTVIVVTSDHGELFGEHEFFSHGNSLYSPTLHVPLLMVFPTRLPRGVSVDHYVTLRDLPATLLDLLSIEDSSFPGPSLAHVVAQDSILSGTPSPLLATLRPAPNQPQWYPSTKGFMQALTLAPYHYIRNGDETEELYHIAEDPKELHNLADTAGVLTTLRAMLETAWTDIRILPPDSPDSLRNSQ